MEASMGVKHIPQLDLRALQVRKRWVRVPHASQAAKGREQGWEN